MAIAMKRWKPGQVRKSVTVKVRVELTVRGGFDNFKKEGN